MNAADSKSDNQATVADIVQLLKQDIEQYEILSLTIPEGASPDGSLPNKCGGNVNFNIESLKVTMKVTAISGKEGKAGLSFKLGEAAALDSGVNGALKESNSQILTFTLYPKDGWKPDKTKAVANITYQDFPISYTLASLRKNLLYASYFEPCMTFSNPNNAKDVASTFEFGFEVEKKKSDTAGFNLVIFSIGGTKSAQQTFSNTITVSFKSLANTSTPKTLTPANSPSPTSFEKPVVKQGGGDLSPQ